MSAHRSWEIFRLTLTRSLCRAVDVHDVVGAIEPFHRRPTKGLVYSRSEQGSSTDAQKIAGDWQAVGDGLARAFNHILARELTHKQRRDLERAGLYVGSRANQEGE